MSETMENVAPILPVEPSWTDEQLHAYEALVIKHGRERVRNFGDRFDAADYLSGAMILYEAIGQFGRVPGGWVFGLMAGKDPVRGERERVAIRCNWHRCKETETVDLASDVPSDWLSIGGLYGGRVPQRFCSIECLKSFVRRLEE